MSCAPLNGKDIVLLGSSLGGGGAERVMANMAAYWSTCGLSVTVITFSAADTDVYSLHSDVKRVALDLNSVSNGALAAIKSNSRRIAAVRRELRATKPRVVISFLTEVNVTLLIAAFGLDIKVIVTERNYPGRDSIGAHWHWLRRMTYRFADSVVAQTNDARLWLDRHTSSRELTTIPNSVVWPTPTGKPEIVPGSIVEEDANVILAVGRLTDQKGFDVLISAFSQIAPRYPDWQLVILGDGELEGELQSLIDTAGISDRVLLAGRAGNVADWYSRCDIFALSSRYEGFPNVLLEAMAFGCAVLSTDCLAGPSDIIEPDINGLMVQSENEQSMALGLNRLMEDSTLRTRLGNSAKSVRSTFAETEIMKRWATLIALDVPQP